MFLFTSLSVRRIPSTLVVCASMLILVACAPIAENRQPQASIKDIRLYQSSETFKAPESDWPRSQWWTEYGDIQLNEIIKEALSASPDMTIATARVRQAQSLTQVSESSLLPQIGASAAVTEQRLSYNYLTPAAITPQGWNDYGIAGIDLKWEIDFWGKNRAGLAAATSELEARRADEQQARLTISASVASSYAELARLFAARDTADQSVNIRKKTTELFDERYKNGLENLGGVRQAQAAQAAAA